MIEIPTASVLRDGELVLGFSWIGGPKTYLPMFGVKPNRMYYGTMGLLPGLEISLDMLQVVGAVDPQAPGVAYEFHRLSNVKYQLPLPVGWPQVALGAQDPFSANGLTRGAIGQTDYRVATYYAVMSQPLGPVWVHVGYGQSQDFINGVFGGADWEIGLGVDVRAEYDSRNISAGLDWHPISWFRIYGARLFPDDWSYGTAFTWRL